MCQPYADKKNHQAEKITEAGTPNFQIRPQRNKIIVTQRIIWKWEGGLRPVGAIGAYAPEGMRKGEWGNIRFRISNFRFGIAEWICKGQSAEKKKSQNGPNHRNHLNENNDHNDKDNEVNKMRVKRGFKARRRRKRVLKLAKGFRAGRSKLFRTAADAVDKALMYSYRDRRARKRDFRQLWIARINAATRLNNLSYSKFIHGLKLARVDLDRKVLAELAISDPTGFKQITNLAAQQL